MNEEDVIRKVLLRLNNFLIIFAHSNSKLKTSFLYNVMTMLSKNRILYPEAATMIFNLPKSFDRLTDWHRFDSSFFK